jgi:hypothetical protein
MFGMLLAALLMLVAIRLVHFYLAKGFQNREKKFNCCAAASETSGDTYLSCPQSSYRVVNNSGKLATQSTRLRHDEQWWCLFTTTLLKESSLHSVSHLSSCSGAALGLGHSDRAMLALRCRPPSWSIILD